MKKMLFGDKRRKAVSALVTLIAIAATAAAYYTLLAGGSGQGTQTLAGAPSGQALTLHLSWSDDLAPGDQSPLTVTADNATSQAQPIHHLSFPQADVTSSDPACTALIGPASHDIYIHSDASGQNLYDQPNVTVNATVPAGATGYSLTSAVQGAVHFVDRPYAQDACQDKDVTIKAYAYPTP